MKPSVFYTSVEDSKKLLNKFGLLKNSAFIKKPISADFCKISRDEDYITTYNAALEHNDYHLLLFDDSFIQFELSEHDRKPILRYSYYQFPFDFPTYNEYLKSKCLELNDVGDEYRDEYDQALIDAPKKDTHLSIRYDYSEKEYKTGSHSVSHFHIGFRNSIRITSSISISPLLFTIFILKNVYFKKWASLMLDNDFLRQYEKIKSKCAKIEVDFFQELDKNELYLM